MKRLLFALACLAWAAQADAQATIFGCDFQDSSPYSCTHQSGTLDLAESGTPGTCGVGGADWAHSHTASGGFNDRGYVTMSYCSAGEGGGSGTFPTGFTFVSPTGATDDAWPSVTTFYGRFRVYFENDFDTGTDTIKWFRAHQDVYDGDQRVIIFIEPTTMCGEDSATHVCFALARNINNGSGPGNPGSDVTRGACAIGVWCHVQFSWRHGVLDTSFVKLWINNNNFATPTSEDTHLSAEPTVPGGSTWARDDTGYQGNWSINGASGAPGLDFTSRFTFRLMDWEIGDAFKAGWADAALAPQRPTFRFRSRSPGEDD